MQTINVNHVKLQTVWHVLLVVMEPNVILVKMVMLLLMVPLILVHNVQHVGVQYFFS